ncbi:glycosyltransferase involved in cell wall biosynthesis [Streptomyces sp. B3I7]|uniref:glycosyltransferase n=1 Tax=Streptomyces sp. B3I7 TaxID=3042269 RepID=UPI002785E1B4|nr:glycosyltransferase [Streptomyces sp. B3I7]MDQ0813360.1 glycosyltransferase involved in cell wall biosynthesis [Streptomyces sp. B3I7]
MRQPTTGRGPLVLHITQPVDGGVARVVGDLVHAQRAAGLRVAVACPDGSRLAGTLRALGAEVHDWPATRSPGRALPGEVRRLRRVLAGTRPDLVHAHSAKAGLVARLAVRGRVPTVFQPHAWSFEAVDGALAALSVRWERWGARWASRVVCVSEAERETGVRAGVRAAWSVVPNGVDTAHHHPAPHADARSGLALLSDTGSDGHGGPLVVCVGRLCRQKGQDVLLRAWPAVVRQVPRARLVLVGDGPEEARLRAAAPASVLFAGAVDEVVPWYRAADLVVLPSRWEGMALAPLEAMACGRPVVLTEVAGARECLPPGEEPVPVERPGPLADRIVALLLDSPLRARLGAEARDHVVATHDVRRTAEAVMEVYRELLAPATPSGPTPGAAPGRAGLTGQPQSAGNARRMAGVRAMWGATGAWSASVAAPRASVRTAHLPKTVRARRTDHVPGGGSVPCASCAVRAEHTTGAEATECRESSHT